MPGKPKIGIVICRYTEHLSGGAEILCRKLAEQMAEFWEIDILTSCALDYNTWKSCFLEGIETKPSYRILRFEQELRNTDLLVESWSEVFERPHTPEAEALWIKRMGPYSPALVHYLEEHVEQYDLFIYVGYLWATTPYGLAKTAHKSILIPAAHDEMAIHLPIYQYIFQSPLAIVYLSMEEKLFVNRYFNNLSVRHEVIPIGVDVPSTIESVSAFREKYQLNDPYLLYIGRVDEGKGCKELIRLFLEYKQSHPDTLKLVLMGESYMELPDHPDIKPLGFVEETFKWAGIDGASAVMMPSQYESLSIVILESWKRGIPVIVNGHSSVLKHQCLRSKGGYWYRDDQEFMDSVEQLMQQPESAKQMGLSGKEYADSFRYSWEFIVNKYRLLGERLLSEPRQASLSPLQGLFSITPKE